MGKEVRLIDTDKISRLGLTMAISERTGDVLKGHARGKEEIIRRAVEVFNQALLQAPTVDLWHYSSQGELPPRGELVLCWLWNGNYVLAFIREDDEWTTNGKNAFDGVKCWQYIVPPKEKE